MAKTYILCGKIASGKTTYANELIKKENGVILSHDEIMLKLFDNCIGPEKHLEIALRISAYFAGVCADYNKKGINSILDYGFWSKLERDFIKDELNKLGVNYEVIYFNINDEIRFNRLLIRNNANQEKVGRQYIIDDELCRMLDLKFEELSADENYILIDK